MANNELIRQAIALLQQALQDTPTVPVDPPVEPPPGVVVPAPAQAITHLILENTSDTPQSIVPFTCGQVFKQGDLKAGMGLSGRFDNGESIPLQVDLKARHSDGSVRHAMISGICPVLFAKEKRKMDLIPVLAGMPKHEVTYPSAQQTGSVSITLDGKVYRADASMIDQSKLWNWLAGPVVTEWNGIVPLRTKDGTQHPHLTAVFAVRVYPDAKNARFDITLENTWAYEPNPRNFTYDVVVEVGGKVVHEEKSLLHFHHARWSKLFWTGDEPQLNIRHDTRYLIDTLALPNYDTSLVIPEGTLAALGAEWAEKSKETMGVGLAAKGMPTTGGRRDIGLLPGWNAIALISMDPRALEAAIGTGRKAGSWSVHYRDRNTGQPISLIDFPFMTILGREGDTFNPATKKKEAFPIVPKEHSWSPYTADSSHQPQFSYLPYLLTGDYYHLQELQFWAMWNVFSTNPGYRQNRKGLMDSKQVRDQAWSMRTLSQAAYITPDDDRLKAHFLEILDSNLDWYNSTYTDNPKANQYGALVGGTAVVYKNMTAIGPWQDDYFTQSIGHAADLGFEKAKKLMQWKGKFVIQRLLGEGTDWRAGSNYTWVVRPSPKEDFFETIGQSFKATIEAAKNGTPEERDTLRVLATNEQNLSGYTSSAMGFPSFMQPAVSAAADYLGEEGRKAAERFFSRQVKPDYSSDPQFDIVPRTLM